MGMKGFGISRRLRALRALLRVEVRQWRRHPWRTLLVLSLIAAPVAAIVGGSLLVRLIEPTPGERALRAMGLADLRVEGVDRWEDLEKAVELLPEASRWARAHAGPERLGVPGRRLRSPGFVLEPELLAGDGEGSGCGLAAGMVELVEGRAPENVGEVALSPALLEALERAVGDEVVLEYGGPRKIVGAVVDPESLEGPLLLRFPSYSELPGRSFLLVDLAEGTDVDDVALGLRMAGFRAQTRAMASTPDEALTALVFVLGTLGLFEAGLVISAAFAIGLRRRQVEIGLIGATGATQGGIAGSLLVSTACLAVVGSLVGVALGIGAVEALHPFLEAWTGRRAGAVDPRPGPVLGAVVLGVIAAVLASVVPARGASRLPIRHALAGRRPVSRRSSVWLVLGSVMIAVGLLVVALAPGEQTALDGLAVILGPLLGLLGFGACAPWVLDSLARRASPLPLAWRLALRDAGRFRERNGAVVTAVLAGMAMSVTVAALVASLTTAIDAFPAPYRDDQLWISGMAAEGAARAIAEDLSAVAAAPLVAAHAHGEPLRGQYGAEDGRPVADRRFGWIALGGEDLARALAVDAATPPLRSGHLLAVDPPEDATTLELSAWLDGTAVVRLGMPGVEVDAAPEALDGGNLGGGHLGRHTKVAPVSADQWVREPPFLLAPEAATALGLETGPPPRFSLTPWVVRLAEPVSEATLERARELAAEAGRAQVDAAILHSGPLGSSYYLIFLISALTGLVIVITATALSAAESAADEWVLHTVGADPGLLRAHAAARASYLALLGCVLACPTGLLAAAAIFGASNFPLSFVMPWRDLAGLVVVLPLIVYGLAWALGTSEVRAAGRAAKGIAGSTARSTAKSATGAVLSLLVLLVSVPERASAETPGVQNPASEGEKIHWQPYEAEAFDGSALPGELGHVRVPLHWDEPEGKQIELAVVRYATSHPSPGPPIFFLAGGPGGSGIEGGALVATHPQLRLLEHADVIGIDQRGTGQSRPNLVNVEGVEVLPTDRAVGRAEQVAALRRAASRVADRLRSEGVEPAAFHTAASADDLDAIRRALGVEKVVIYGASYGSHLGLEYLRRHGEHVSRAVLSKVEGPDHTWKLPARIDQHLGHVARMVAGDPALDGQMPDLLATLDRVLAGLEAEPLRAVDDGGTGVVIGPHDLRIEVARALGTSEAIAALPALLHALHGALLDREAEGNPSTAVAGLAATALDNRRVGVHALALAMDCASGATGERWREIERTRAAGPLGDAIFAPFYPEACGAASIPELGDAFRRPVESVVPVLFSSGTLDARTPPENVDEILGGFPNAVHVRVENAGHESRELMSPEYRDVLQSFLRGEPVTGGTITLPEPFFEASSTGDRRRRGKEVSDP